MSIQSQIVLRTKKLGVLLRDARLAARKSLDECASAVGVTRGVFGSYEQGRKSPSLPEIEVLTFFLGLPINHFWGRDAISDDAPPTDPLNLPALMGVRQRMIGALLRRQRMEASISVKALSEQTGIPQSRIKAYELGERPIPVPELEGLLAVLDGRVESFFDQSGPIGQWMNQQKAVDLFLKLPTDLQDFVCQPVNLPYLELARKLSALSATKLRSVAEDLLDITF